MNSRIRHKGIKATSGSPEPFGQRSLSGVSRERAAALADLVRATFGFPAAIAMGLGLLVGLGFPEVDDWLEVQVPLFVFSTQDAARSMLETIATATVAVAGISISVTIVAFTLSANQLSPRVLRSFRRDLTSQLTLAAFLGTFIYCLAVLVRLGSLGAGRVPNLSIAVAVVLALIAFALFANFIGHIANMLQPSSIIASIADDARSGFQHPYPSGIGNEPEDEDEALAEARRLMDSQPTASICSYGEGFLVTVRGGELVAAAVDCDALILQRARIGEYVLPGQGLADVWTFGEEPTEIESLIASRFELGSQRTLPQDPGFPIRQLADVALKGLSPGINDPTTACTAMEAMTAGLIKFAAAESPSRVRVDRNGAPRFVATAVDLEELVLLGFTQVAVFARQDPTVVLRLRELLGVISDTADRQGMTHRDFEQVLCQSAQ